MLQRSDHSTSKFAEASLERIGLRPSAKVLDAPCGFGRHAYWLSQLGHNVVGVDIDKKRIDAAAREAPTKGAPIKWLVADIEREVSIFDATFDLALVVHYFSDRIIDLAAKALKPGSHVIFETFGGHGQNWIGLPNKGWSEKAVKDNFRIVTLTERPVGPNRDNVAIQMLAERLG